MKALLTTFELVWTTILAAALPADPAEREQQMLVLQQRCEGQKNAQDWDGATATIREMAALDPEHPKVYLQIVLVQDRRAKGDDATALMDSLGLPHGPGRTYRIHAWAPFVLVGDPGEGMRGSNQAAAGATH